MKNLALTASLLGALSFGAGCTSDGGDPGPFPDATITVVNRSDFAIERIHLTDVGSRSWGDNLLYGDLLYPGEELVLGVDCGYYDAFLVDEDGVECVVERLDLCFNDATWFIYNDTCEAFEAAAQARKAAAAAATAAETKAAPADAAK